MYVKLFMCYVCTCIMYVCINVCTYYIQCIYTCIYIHLYIYIYTVPDKNNLRGPRIIIAGSHARSSNLHMCTAGNARKTKTHGTRLIKTRHARDHASPQTRY